MLMFSFFFHVQILTSYDQALCVYTAVFFYRAKKKVQRNFYTINIQWRFFYLLLNLIKDSVKNLGKLKKNMFDLLPKFLLKFNDILAYLMDFFSLLKCFRKKARHYVTQTHLTPFVRFGVYGGSDCLTCFQCCCSICKVIYISMCLLYIS